MRDGPPSAAGRPSLEEISTVQESAFPGDWYDLSDPHHFWFTWRLNAALRQIDHLGLDRRSPLRVLDIGCGSGIFRDQLETATNWAVDATDLNLDALRRAGPGRGRLLYYDVLEQRPEFRDRYDVVFLFDVIEHVEQPRPLVGAAAAHLRKGGMLLVNVPALQALYSAYDVAAGHHRRYAKPSLVRESQEGGLEVRDVRYWGLSLLPLLLLRKLLLGKVPSPETIRQGFQPPNRLVNTMLATLARVEAGLLARPPLGASLLMAAQRS
jgi:2-polyprenyl-3-methyl-5-hydroxy-6-metoxy-1,4-benzoquinol methylase